MKTPNRIEAGCVAIFENIFEDPQSLIYQIEKECLENRWEWTRARTVSEGENSKHRTNFSINLSRNANSGDLKAAHIHNMIYDAIESGLNWYNINYSIHRKFYHEPYSVLKYDEGQEFKNHFDGSTETARSISVLIYLNDNYTGGEIEFTNFKLKIKPNAGSMMLFPSNFAYAHAAHPVISGTKYAIVTWLHDWLSPSLPQYQGKSLTEIGRSVKIISNE